MKNNKTYFHTSVIEQSIDVRRRPIGRHSCNKKEKYYNI